MSDLYITGPVTDAAASAAAVGSRYLCTTWAAREALLAREVEPDRLWDGISREVGAALDTFVLDRAMRWYRDGDADVTEFYGMSLGGIHEWMTWFSTFVPVYKFGAALHYWLAREQPTRVWLDAALDAHWPAVLAAALAQWQPAARSIILNGSNSTAGALRPWRPQMLRPRHYLAGAAWNILARLRRTFSSHSARTHILSFNYHTLESVLGALLAEPQRFRVSLADRPSPRYRWLALKRGAELMLPQPMPLTGDDRRRVRDIQDRWHALADTADFQQQFVWAGCNLWPALYPDLARIIDVDLPRTAALAKGYFNTLRRARPDCILLPFDSAYLHQTVIEAARQLNIPSVVMLHGLPGIYHRGGCSQRSDYLLVWGDEIARRFVQAGRRADRIFQVGMPQAAAAPMTTARRHQAATATVLLLTNPFGNGTVLSAEDDAEIYLFAILDELCRRPNLQVLLRPHPSESAAYYQQSVMARHYDRVQLAATEPIPDLLSRSDLVIGPISTVLVDALLARVPVVCVNFGKITYPAPFDGRWAVPLVTTIHELRAQLDRLEQDAFGDQASSIIDGFCGPRDGQTLRRVLDTLEQLALQHRT